MRKSLGILVISIIAVGLFMSAGQANFIDVEAANKEIAELEARDAELQKSIEELKQQNAELAARNSELEGLIREANIILDDFKKSNGQLHNFFSTLTDAEQRRAINEKMVANRVKQNELEAKKRGWIDEIHRNNDMILRTKRFVGLKENILKRNMDRIDYLKASIEMSQGQNTSLDSAFSTADEVRGKADQLLAK